eukprot:8021187-Pyramimonas_sp.AAC.1
MSDHAIIRDGLRAQEVSHQHCRGTVGALRVLAHGPGRRRALDRTAGRGRSPAWTRGRRLGTS